MSTDPETIQVGQCYLTIRGKVRRVTALYSDRVQFQQRLAHQRTWRANKFYLLDLLSFARAAERVVSRDWVLSEPIGVQADILQVGTCYLAENGTVRRVVSLIEGRVAFAQRRGPVREPLPWPRTLTLPLDQFVNTIERPVPCDWTAEMDDRT